MPRLELLRLWVWVEEENENHSLKNVGKLFESDLLIRIQFSTDTLLWNFKILALENKGLVWLSLCAWLIVLIAFFLEKKQSVWRINILTPNDTTIIKMRLKDREVNVF